MMKKHQMTPFTVHGKTGHRLAHAGKGSMQGHHGGMAHGGHGHNKPMQDDDSDDVDGGSKDSQFSSDYSKDDGDVQPSQPMLSQTPSPVSPMMDTDNDGM